MIPLCFYFLTAILTAFFVEKSDFNVISRRMKQNNICDEDWFLYDRMCYRAWGVEETYLQWEEASQHCKELGGSLASIHSQELSDFLRAFILLNAQETLWIGLKKIKNESVFVWDDGTPFDYENWEPDEPPGFSIDEEVCVEFVFASGKTTGLPGQWNAITCSISRNFICQKKGEYQLKDARLCPDGGWKFKTSCYHVFERRLTWQDAEDYCIGVVGGHLVTINDFSVNLFLEYVLRKFIYDVWIGIKTKNEFQQQWSSGWYVAFTDWMFESHDFPDGMCAVRTLDKWNMMFCKRRFSFICEISNKTVPHLASPENMICPNEPSDWRDLGGKYCYHFIKQHLTWSEANFICLRRGGTLASFHSQTELEVIQPLLMAQYLKSPSYSWIGLLPQSEFDGSLQWADGTPMDFVAWSNNEPNFQNEQCVELNPANLKWYDRSCDQARPSICSIQKISPNKTTNNEAPTVTCSCTSQTTDILIGVICCCLFVICLLTIAVRYFSTRVKHHERQRKMSLQIRKNTEFDIAFRQLDHQQNDENFGHTSGYEVPIEDDYDNYEYVR